MRRAEGVAVARRNESPDWRLPPSSALSGLSGLSGMVGAGIAAPLHPAAASHPGEIDLTWDASAGATGYNLYRGTAPGAEVFLAGTASSPYADAAVADDTAYYYRVTATWAAGESGRSAEVSATTPPATPTGLVATPALS